MYCLANLPHSRRTVSYTHLDVYKRQGLIIAIMIMALLMDMGMYYNSYRRLKAVSDFANEELTLEMSTGLFSV